MDVSEASDQGALAVLALAMTMAPVGRVDAQDGACTKAGDCHNHGLCSGYSAKTATQPEVKGKCSCNAGYSGNHCENNPCQKDYYRGGACNPATGLPTENVTTNIGVRQEDVRTVVGRKL